MTFWSLIWATIRHNWRESLGIVAGVAVTAAVLVGALTVGDSVRATLRARAEARIGRVDRVLDTGERFVTDGLADRLVGSGRAASVLRLPGFASSTSGAAQVSSTAHVTVFGVTDAFFAGLAPRKGVGFGLEPGGVLLNERLARNLSIEAGALEGSNPPEVLLRVEKSSLLPRDSAVARIDDISFGLRAKVVGIVGDDEFGRFSLVAGQAPPASAFVDRTWMQTQLDLDGRSNLVLLGEGTRGADLAAALTCDDLQLEIDSEIGQSGRVALRSERIFLEQEVVDAAATVLDALGAQSTGVLTWFVNDLRAGERATPYSTVTAGGPLTGSAGENVDPLLAVLEGVDGTSFVATRWLAEDLEVDVGASVELEYFFMEAGQRLTERARSFRVARVIDDVGVAGDRTLMPPFPGLSGSDSCRDWEPGMPVDLDRIRDRDENYWSEYGGAPKAFVTLAAGRSMWSGPSSGSLSGIRFDAAHADAVLAELPEHIDPARVGLVLRDVRRDVLASSTAATDFGGLFLGLSMFLIAAALILTALLFAFAIERRAPQIGAVLAVGWLPKQVRRALLAEAAALGAIGGIVGAGLGLLYTRVVLAVLSGGGWRGALGGEISIDYAPTIGSVLFGTVAALLAALATIYRGSARPFRVEPVALLKSRGGFPAKAATAERRLRLVLVLAVLALLGALGLFVATPADGSAQAMAGAFFGIGSLLLVGWLLLCRLWLGSTERASRPLGSVAALGRRNASRRAGRSVATVALLASGTFLVVSVQAFRLEPPSDPTVRATGTGGFALWARTVLPILRDPDTATGREAYYLDEDAFLGTDFVPLQVVAGDDASCLNLGSPQSPRLVGVEAGELDGRGAFAFGRVLDEPAEGATPWALLDRDYGEGVVPAIGDQASLMWTLHKQVGDKLRYVDDRGREFDVLLVAETTNSLMQGSLFIADRHLEERFPSTVGFREFFIDAPVGRVGMVRRALLRALADFGPEVLPTQVRLRDFQAVQNTYLVIFRALGGLGLLLGSVGLGLVVLRNVLERRAELATALAVGFSPARVRWLVWSEHGALLGAGLAGGGLAAAVAIWPGARSAAGVAWWSVASLVVGIAVAGALWVTLATFASTRGSILAALRDE